MASRRPIVNVSGTLKEIPSGDVIPVAALATGTPTGSKFIRDDGTLADVATSLVGMFAGPVWPITGAMRWYPQSTVTTTSVTAWCSGAPSGNDLVVDVLKNGTSIFSSSQPTIAATEHVASPVSVSVSVLSTDYLTVDVVSGTCSDLCVRIDFS